MKAEFFHVDLHEGDFIIEAVDTVTAQRTPFLRYPAVSGKAPADLVDAVSAAEDAGDEVQYSPKALALLGGPL